MKILIITNNPHYCSGGIEKYQLNLLKLLVKRGHDVHELCVSSPNFKKIQTQVIKDNNIIFLRNLYKKSISIFLLKIIIHLFSFFINFFSNEISKKIKCLIPGLYIKKFLRSNYGKFDFFIFNISGYPSIKKISNKSVSVQHGDPKLLINYSKFEKIMRQLTGNLIHFYNSNKIVVFSKNSKLFFEKNIKNNKKYFILSSSSFTNDQVKNNFKKNGINFVSRGTNEKRIDIVLNISKYTKEKINIIGDTDRNIDFKKFNNVEYRGELLNKKVIKFISKGKFTMVMSDFEGLPLVCIESLWAGVPLIIRDTFLEAKFLINNGTNGILIPKDMTPEDIAILINQVDYMKYDIEKIKKFANIFFSLKKFEETWDKVLIK